MTDPYSTINEPATAIQMSKTVWTVDEVANLLNDVEVSNQILYEDQAIAYNYVKCTGLLAMLCHLSIVICVQNIY